MKVCSTIWANFIPCAFVARSSSTVRQCPVSALIGLASVFKVHSSIQSHTGADGLASTSARRAIFCAVNYDDHIMHTLHMLVDRKSWFGSRVHCRFLEVFSVDTRAT